jgi:hypothetical protein
MAAGITLWVYDPDEKKEVALHVRRGPSGDVVIHRLPDHNFAGGETPRLLEKKAAFVEIATRTYGRRWEDGRSPVWGALETNMPTARAGFVHPLKSKRAEKQQHYRDLVGPEVLQRVADSGEGRARYFRRRPGGSRREHDAFAATEQRQDPKRIPLPPV